MYSLKQLVISGRKRRWILMDLETSLPLLYPLRYHIDHLAFRSLSTQSASLQSVKFFYEFWRQKYGVSFCYSFYSSDHNPDIAVGEMPAFWMYRRDSQPNFQRCTLIGGISFHIVENMVGFRLVRSDYLSKKRILIMLLFIPCYSD